MNINQKITALLAGKAIPNDEKDILVVGTVGSVLAYNVDLNSDLFYKEVSDIVLMVLSCIEYCVFILHYKLCMIQNKIFRYEISINC